MRATCSKETTAEKKRGMGEKVCGKWTGTLGPSRRSSHPAALGRYNLRSLTLLLKDVAPTVVARTLRSIGVVDRGPVEYTAEWAREAPASQPSPQMLGAIPATPSCAALRHGAARTFDIALLFNLAKAPCRRVLHGRKRIRGRCAGVILLRVVVGAARALEQIRNPGHGHLVGCMRHDLDVEKLGAAREAALNCTPSPPPPKKKKREYAEAPFAILVRAHIGGGRRVP